MDNNCYVYGYFDPNTNALFYVGKGTNHRDYSHLKPSLWGDPNNTCNPFLYYKIQGLMNSGHPPIVKRLHENLSEDDAYRIEYDIINANGRRFVDGGTLFNISGTRGGSPKGRPKIRSAEMAIQYKKSCYANRKANDKDAIRRMYIDQLMTRREIAEHYGVSEVLIKKRLSEFGITKTKSQIDETFAKVHAASTEVRSCKACALKFSVIQSKTKMFCTTECSAKYKLCSVVFKGIEYTSKYEAAEVTGYSIGYIMNMYYKEKRDD